MEVNLLMGSEFRQGLCQGSVGIGIGIRHDASQWDDEQTTNGYGGV